MCGLLNTSKKEENNDLFQLPDYITYPQLKNTKYFMRTKNVNIKF